MIIVRSYIAIPKDSPPEPSSSGNRQSRFSVALYLALTAELPAQTTMIVPFFKQVAIPLGVTGFVALAYL